MKFIQARHFRAGGNEPVSRIVIHSMEMAEKPDTAEACAQYFATTDRDASAHFAVDNNSVVGCVKEGDTAFHAPPNAHSIGIEHAGYAKQQTGEWLDAYGTAMLRDVSAPLVRDLCNRHGIPKVWLSVDDLLAGKKGVTSHNNVSQAWHKSCVTADTPILCRDLVWRPAGDLLVGDEIVAFDEDAPNQEGRRFRNAVVTANRLERDVLLRVNTPRGAVRCNYDHPWLVRRGKAAKWGKWTWVRAEELNPGDEAMFIMEPWEVDRSWEAGWLAGMYDGEGWFSRTGKSAWMGVCQRESDTADRLAAAVKARTTHCTVRRLGSDESRRQTLFQFVTSKRADMMRVLGSVRPPRLLAIAQDFWVGGSLGKSCERVTIESIEPAGTGVIASLSTSTQTYIAAGFAMHNTHTDPGAGFPVAQFMAWVNNEQGDGFMAALTDAEQREIYNNVRNLAAAQPDIATILNEIKAAVQSDADGGPGQISPATIDAIAKAVADETYKRQKD